VPGDVAAEGSEGDVAFHVAGSIGLTSLPVTQRSSAPRIRPFSIHREERWLRSVQAALVAEPTAQGQSSRSRSSGRRTHGSTAHGL